MANLGSDVLIRRKGTLAKLTRPHLHGAVLRERLFERLQKERAQRRAIWVVGPPGAGKTTLVASWLTKSRLPGIWYQIDGGDSDLAAFFYCLRLAAESHRRKGHKPLPLFTPEYGADVDGFARRFFRELFSRLPADVTLVLDNYQEVPAEQPFHAIVSQAIDEIPQGITLIVVSRRDPPDCYARLIANENVGFIDWDELKLTAAEAKTISAKRTSLSDADFNALYQASEGWAAGLTLMLERLKRGGQVPDRLDSSTRESVFNYFAGVIFDHLPSEAQNILLTVAILPHFSAQTAERVSGQASAGELLEHLFTHRLFIDRRSDPAAAIYQFHALFREFLLVRGRTRFTPAEHASLSLRAGEILARQGEAQEAVRLYCGVNAWEAASRVIGKEAAHLLGKGRWQSLLEWIALLPTQHVNASAALLYWRGMAHIAHDPALAIDELQAALHLFAQAREATGQLTAIVGILGAYFVQDKSLAHFERWIDPMAALFAQIHTWPAPAIELEARSMFLLSASHLRPDHPLIPSTALSVLNLLQDDRIDTNTRAAGGLRALVYFMWAGEAELARRVNAQLEALLLSDDALEVHVAMGYAFRGLYQHLTLTDSVSAAGSVERALSIAREKGLANSESMASQFQGIVSAALGRNLDMADTALRRVAALGFAGSLNKETTYHLTQACAYKWRGDIAAALRHAGLCLRAARANCPAFLVIVGSNLVNIYADAGEYEQARDLADEVRNVIQGTCLDNFGAALALEEAYLALRRENRAQCHEKLRVALGLAQDNSRHAATIHYMGGAIAAMFAEALRSGIETEYVCHLIRHWNVPAPSDAPVNWPFPLTVQTLGRFEVRLHGKPLEFTRKVPRKVMDLLKVIIAFGGKEVAIERIHDALWPDLEADSAHGAFATALYRLRKILREADSLVLKDAKLSLDTKSCRCDALFLESLSFRGPDERGTHIQITDLYQGMFLPDDNQAPWTVPARERLRRKFILACSTLGRDLETRNAWDQAIALCSRAIETDDLAEEFYQRLMRCHLQIGQHGEAAAVFRQLRTRLSVILGLAPSAASNALFEQTRTPATDR